MVKQAQFSDEDRDGLLSKCSGTSDLIEWLDGLNRRPGLNELDNRLSNLKVDLKEIKSRIGYSEDGYQRNVVKKNEHYEVVIICWTPGQETPIHDHVGSDCAFLILSGEATETIYEANDEGLAVRVNERKYLPGEVCAAEEPDIHRVSNETNGSLINLHVYTPPLSGFKMYSPANF